MRKMKIMILFLLVITSIFGEEVFKKGYEGYWMLPDRTGILKIVRQEDGEYTGNLVWLREPIYPKGDPMEGMEKRDRRNPDKSLRDRKSIGLKVVGKLYLKDGELKGGYIYDTLHGWTYHGKAKQIEENLVKLRGSLDRWGIFGITKKAHRILDLKKYGLEEKKEKK